MANKKNLTPEENKNHQDFLTLCAYIETEILGYEKTQKLQRAGVNRVRGLAKGQVFANNNQEQHGEYPYEVILLTLKANKDRVLNAMRNKNFDSEAQAIGYMAAIIRDRLNDMYTRYINAKKSKEKINSVNTDIMEYKGAEYKPVERDNKNEDKFKELW